MGIDFQKLFEDAGNKAQAAVNDLVKVGTPALKSSLEQWGIDTLTQMHKESERDLNMAVKEVTATSPQPGSFGAALNATVQGSVLQTYGMEITLGVAALILIGFMLKGK